MNAIDDVEIVTVDTMFMLTFDQSGERRRSFRRPEVQGLERVTNF